ncbi:PAS domain S-box protein [Fortiea contorta]|uniref:PAS domain S-box protein n=1 Tax=Fortiea contorta TaxID=1892405 RepID=UPI00034BEF46|nr:PAS domain S-box protein [Fortiea contorta]
MTDQEASLGANRRSTRIARLLPYGVAIFSVALALGLTLILLPWLYPTTTPLFLMAVMVSAWYGGLGTGFLATVLSTLVINYFFIEPYYSLQAPNFEVVLRLSTFAIAAALISSLNQSRRSALQKTEAALQSLQETMEREREARAVSEAAENAAQAAKAQLETVLASINDGFYVLDHYWRFTYVSDRYCEMVGMQRSQILGENVWELFPLAVDTDAYVQFHRAINEQTSLQFDYYYAPWNCWHDHRIYPSASGLTVFLTDISDRKLAEATLSSNQQQLQSLIDGIPHAVWVLDSEGEFCFSNQQWLNYYGVPFEEARAQGWSQLHPDDLDATHQQWQMALKTGFPHETEFRWCFADGSERWYLCRAQPIRNQSGQIVQWVGTNTDITNLKQVEAALQESQRFMQQVAETLPGLLYVYDLVTERNVYVNSQALEVLGYTPEQIQSMGENITQLMVHPDDIPLVRAYNAQFHTAAADVVLPLELRIQHANGDWIWFLFHATVFSRTPEGVPQQVLGVAINISDRKKTEADLQQSNDRFHRAMQAVEGIVFEWNMQTQTVYRSQGLLRLIGVRAEDAPPTAQWWTERLHPDDRRRIELESPAVVANSDRYEGEYRVRHEAGHWVDVWERGYLQRNSQGEVTGIVGFTTDISQRKQAAADLQESESRFRSMADNISQFTWMTDASGWIFWYNERWFDYTGTTLEEMQGWGWQKVHHPDHVDRVVTHFRQAIATGESWEDTFPLRGRDGTYRWFLSRALPIRDETGQIRRWFGTNTDITEIKQTQEALHDSESRLRLIFESAKDYAIFTLNLDGAIASWNSGAERLLGYTEAEVIGSHGEIIFTPEDQEQRKPDWEMQTALTQGRAENERWHVRKDTSRFWGSGLMMPLLDEAGKSQGFVKILQDKTSQRQAGERLQLLYETTRDLLSTEQPLAMINTLYRRLSHQLELDCYYNFMVEEKDNRWLLHLRNYDGISQEEAQAFAWIEFGEYLCGLIAQTRQQFVLNHEQILTHPHAECARTIGLTAYAGQPLIAQGRLLGTLSFASRTRTHFTPAEIDLLQSACDQIAIALERANLTASLQQQAQQLQQANRIKDEFLAVLSHELRSPLNPILGWSKLLQTNKLDQTKTAQALATIERNAKLQSELIEDLLDVSRILQGKLSLNIRPVDLALTVTAAIETVSLAAEAKSIEIKTVLDTQLGQILGDSSRLQQIVWNLVSNAVKFTPNGGRVEVKLSSVTDDAAYAQITVQDTGKGIAPEFLPHVFDYFRQEDGTTTRKFGGLGLGLAIVRHLVESHGGTVHADSPGEGQGATFSVRLPLAATISQQNNLDQRLSLSATDDQALKGKRVLIVDDEQDMRDLISFTLEQAGADVVTVTNALEALTALAQFQPDILLSDIGMADMDGYMLLRQVRTLPPDQGGQVPAIALTAYAGEFDQKQALQAGFQQHLSKPIEPEALIRAVNKLMQNRR